MHRDRVPTNSTISFGKLLTRFAEACKVGYMNHRDHDVDISNGG